MFSGTHAAGCNAKNNTNTNVLKMHHLLPQLPQNNICILNNISWS